jgi:hypothetical protein
MVIDSASPITATGIIATGQLIQLLGSLAAGFGTLT